MGTLGTFDAFTSSRLGIYAAMQGLRVTGNNISNINTAGYTRQRVDQYSLKTGSNDRYASFLDNHVGNGALVKSISQIRDPYLDIRYRATSAEVGYYGTKLEGLEEIAAILDEVGKGGKDDETKGDGLLYAQLQDLAEKLRSYGANPTDYNDTLIQGSAEALVALFNTYAGKLEQLQKDSQDAFDKSIVKVNEILTNIQGLNKSIRECEIHGDKALEMRDERNRQIDALSEYMDIKVEYSMEDVGAGIEVEKLTIYLGNANPDPTVESDSSILVDGLYATQFNIPEQRPVMNPYSDPSADDLALNPDFAKLKGYLFLREVDPADPDAVAVTINGKNCAVVGTNDPAAEGIVTEDNDNLTIQLGKLLDVKGNEWTKHSSIWSEATGGTIGVNAIYHFTISTDGTWTDGDTLKVAGNTYTVGTDLTVDAAKNADSLAAFIASKLGSDPDYYISTNGADIVYTAKKAGKIGGKGPGAAPTPTVENGGNKLGVTPNTAADTAGVDSVPPADSTTTIDPYTGAKTTIAYTEVDGKWFRVQMETEYTREVALDDNDLFGKLQAQRELLTEEGEFSCDKDVTIDENAAIKRGIPYYRKSFDLLAQKFAEAYNQLNTGYALNQDGNYIDKDGNELLVPGVDGVGRPVNRYTGLDASQSENLINNGYFLKDENGNAILNDEGKATADLNAWLDKFGGVKMGGPLFSNSGDGDDTSNITASNISISTSWSHGAIHVVPKFEVLYADADNPEGIEQSTLNINVNHMITMINKDLAYDPRDLIGSDATGPLLFTGSFNDMFSNMMGVQANDARTTNVKLNTSYVTQVELDSSREGVSGVDLNDEAMNMMQFQKAYSAACRLMTAIDESLDRLINNTGVAGR